VDLQQELRTCLVCGFRDIEEFCSKCGSPLMFLGEPAITPLRTFGALIKEYLSEVVSPVLAFLKTTWLLLFAPIAFFSALSLSGRPIAHLKFPLSSIWAKLSPRPQYVLSPVIYYISSIATLFLFELLTEFATLEVLIGRATMFREFDPIRFLTYGGIRFLYPLCVAFVFDALTERDGPSASLKYAFWLYVSSLGWTIVLSPLVATILLLPCLLATKVVQVLTSGLGYVVGNAFTSLLHINTSLIALSLATYLFLALPYRVYKHLWGRAISTRRLVLTILASIIGPLAGLVLLFCACTAPLSIL
jgi:hypothetical protein